MGLIRVLPRRNQEKILHGKKWRWDESGICFASKQGTAQIFEQTVCYSGSKNTGGKAAGEEQTVKKEQLEMRKALWKDAWVMFWAVAALLAANAGFISYSPAGRRLAVGLLGVYLLAGWRALAWLRRTLRRTCTAAETAV